MKLVFGAQAEGFADWILARPQGFGGGFAEDSGNRSRGGKGVTEEKRNAEGLKVVWLNEGVEEKRFGVGARGRIAVDGDGGVTEVRIIGSAGTGDGGDIGQGSEPGGDSCTRIVFRSAV